MTRISRKLRNWTYEKLDLPQDIVFNLPRLTMVGNKELFIENHNGVIHFSPDKLILALTQGSLEIEGSELMIRSILPKEVLIEGTVKNIKYIETEESH
ncbi:sporulation protein YqfC [Paenibacillus macquariensis]|uniref:Sporulation protein YqfC n=1 Tax=Paenibacillus macquariensis TaxID=948756 RepID=A0ABY1K166_9BACL|nr:sporulation protein YqfC [Paenibacillus macquariensis]MEC0091863.1 sporulation protein YqfC [Paenibacillus macquariensis]OAB32231.1 sporulation protein YqfC [Paenibacillus macquariensis subsp. macquariensis]SIR10690.1 sporulation protein YqfC [Paenibacillus macquariensis]